MELNLKKHPIDIFSSWLDEAKISEVNDPDAMSFSSVSDDGYPSVRMVLLRKFDKNGFISEGSGENLFIVKDAKLLTPKTDFCLNGITRQSVIEIAQNLGIQVQEKDLVFDELVNADEAFFSGTAVEITPITKVDNLKIGSGMIGPVSERLQTKYSEIVCGKDANYTEWLTNI